MVVGDIATGTDLVVIGAGPGGYSAAIRAAQEGQDVVLVDKEKIGGTCLNRGCIPAKAFIHASKFHDDIQHWNNIGIKAECEHVNFKEIKEWKDSIVEKLDQGVKQMLEHENIEYKKGEAKFIDSNTVRVEEEHRTDKIEFENAIIATGSSPIEIPGLEFDKDKIISSRELLNLEHVPDEIVVVGGGYIGMEAVTKFCKFGATVKVVEARDRVLANFDEEIVSQLQEVSDHYNDEIYTSTKAEEVKYRDDKAVLVADQEGEKVEIEGDYILVAAGRTTKPNLESLELENTDVEVDEGFVKTDQQMRTTDENIFAIGDVVGQPMLAHKAYREGKVAGEVAAGKKAAFDNQYIPKAMYTDPEVASVGLNPEEAREKHDNIKVGRFPLTASGRALTTTKTDGFIRVVAREDGKLLGSQIVGARASDMIAEATLALEMQAYLDDVANTIHAHPTFPEGFAEACEDALDKSIHTY
ncbi:dihydrolipoyl dehydrogenase [Candidatus Nanohalovita haloferacivicina]|uniref:dihydrolipoyl dehydrogenase n=1 Tax=Candidatus Nanohalovita haloferacivicina TaxID=2978046 RepID=UPI00325FD0D1|nr:Pyruvate/2-oxoglutarate dehydrogenase complex, dihydrolipoamide dehydrogenase (E3) component [Candidatus Nanohalobia archaeon BNXNv]